MKPVIIDMFFNYIRLTVVSNVSMRRTQQLVLFFKYVVIIYEESAEEILQTLSTQYPNSDLDALNKFVLSCFNLKQGNCFLMFNDWLDSLKDFE